MYVMAGSRIYKSDEHASKVHATILELGKVRRLSTVTEQ